MYVKPIKGKSVLWRFLVGLFFFISIIFFQNFTTEINNSNFNHLTGVDGDVAVAEKLFRRITGVRIPIDDPRLHTMAGLIREGDRFTATALAVEDPNFYNVTLREMSSLMSTRAIQPNEPINDFIATFIGMVRDDVDAREMLTADYFYSGNPNSLPNDLPNELVDDILMSNNHYMYLDRNAIDLKEHLQRQPSQFLVSARGSALSHVDPAGLLTSRTFMASHAVAGTNRRLVEYAFKSFMCLEINQWADTSLTDIRVGRDVDRFPEGSNSVFQRTCKGCHSGMDSLRPAFAYYDFDDGYVKYAQLLPEGRGRLEMEKDDFAMPAKFSRADDVFPEGYIVRDNRWENVSTAKKHDRLLGWRGALNGTGLKDFGAMLAGSRGFSSCMVERVFKSVCRRSFKNNEETLKEILTNSFETHYSLKRLYQETVIREECIGM